MIKSVIFDMDGLMFDTERLYIKAWKYAGNKSGYNITEQLLNETRGTSGAKSKLIFENWLGKDYDHEAVRQHRVKYVNNYINKNGVPCKKGLKELLLYLKNRNYKIGLATSTDKDEADKYLRIAEVYEYFDIKMYGNMVINGKPNPEIYIECCKKLGYEPEKCLVLEDSYNGIKSAYEAGCNVIMIPDTMKVRVEDKYMLFDTADTLKDVIEIIEKINDYY